MDGSETSNISHSKDSFKIGSKCVIVQDCDLRGNITLGTGNVVHPRATILALAGPIILGNNNIVEENVVIVNRSRSPMMIGDENHFQIAARIESPSIGSYNIFCPRSRVSFNVSIGSNCQIGAACIVLASPFTSSPTPPSASATTPTESNLPLSDQLAPPPTPKKPTSSSSTRTITHIPDTTTIYSSECRASIWSGEGSGQARAFHTKHLIYLRETLVKYHKLKIFAKEPPVTTSTAATTTNATSGERSVRPSSDQRSNRES